MQHRQETQHFRKAFLQTGSTQHFRKAFYKCSHFQIYSERGWWGRLKQISNDAQTLQLWRCWVIQNQQEHVVLKCIVSNSKATQSFEGFFHAQVHPELSNRPSLKSHRYYSMLWRHWKSPHHHHWLTKFAICKTKAISVCKDPISACISTSTFD